MALPRIGKVDLKLAEEPAFKVRKDVPGPDIRNGHFGHDRGNCERPC